MTDTIASLTDEQAIHAIRLFYDFVPPNLWENEEKPSIDRVEKIAVALVENTPSDIQPILAALIDDHQPEQSAARAEVCRLILSQLLQSSAFDHYADQAINTAKQPQMAIDPITGVFIIALIRILTSPGGGRVH